VTEPAPRVLIAGAGDVGLALGAVLAQAGLTVTTLNRSGRAVAGATAAVGDITDPASLVGIGEFDVVVFAAAPDRREVPDNSAAYSAAYVDGPRHVLAALDRPPARALLVSTTGVYGDDDGRWITASSPPNPQTRTAEVVLDGEQRLAKMVPTTVIRAAGIYGPGRTHLIDSVTSGRLGVSTGSADRWTNRIHRDDLVAALALASVHGAPPPLAIAVDNEPVPRDVVLRWLADRLGVELTADTDPAGRVHGKRCRNAELKDLGWAPAYASFREGYESMIETS